jgi:hypothetical protein
MHVVIPRRETGYQNNEFCYSESGEEFSVFTSLSCLNTMVSDKLIVTSSQC